MAAKERNIMLQVSILIAAWLCFFLLPFQFFPYDKSKSPLTSPRFIQLFTVSNLFLVGFYYLNTRLLIPRFLALKKTPSLCILCCNLFFYVSHGYLSYYD